MSHLTLIERNDQSSSEVEAYLRKLLRTSGGGELATANSRNEQMSANASFSPKSDVIITLSSTSMVSEICIIEQKLCHLSNR